MATNCIICPSTRPGTACLWAVALLIGLNPNQGTAAITKGPYPQNVTTDAVTIVWETDVIDTESRLTYWVPGEASQVVSNVTPTFSQVLSCIDCPTESHIYEVRIDEGLPEETTGSYVVASASDSALGQFTTASRTATHFQFAVYGDSRSNALAHGQVLGSLYQHHTPSNPLSLILHTGDIVSAGFTYTEWHTGFFPTAGAVIREIPFYPVLGNHELAWGNVPWYYHFFDLPDNGFPTQEENWYSYDFGNVHFVCLDTVLNGKDLYHVPPGAHDFRPASAQYQWLVDDLSSASSRDGTSHILAVMHHPPYSSGTHGFPITTEPISPTNTNVVLNIREHLVPLFEQYGVDVVFGGHDHLYERSFKDGVHYIVTGGGGAPPYAANQVENPYQRRALSDYHYCVVKVVGDDLTVTAYTKEGQAFDRVSLRAQSSVDRWQLFDASSP